MNRQAAAALATLLTVSGCATEQPHATLAQEEEPPIELRAGTFDDTVPIEWQTQLLPLEEGGVQFDASEHRYFFPMPRYPRKFESTDEFVQFSVDYLHAEPRFYENELTGMEGAYTSVGHMYFYDPQIKITYVVDDPLAAYLGGITGSLVVGEHEYCLDPDGDCSGELASYLAPEGELTRPTQVEDCDPTNTFCARGHSFFNLVPWVFPAPVEWARHGTREEVSRGGATGTRVVARACEGDEEPDMTFRLCWPFASGTGGWDRECGDFSFCRAVFHGTSLHIAGHIVFVGNGGYIDSVELPEVGSTGESSVESARYCFEDWGVAPEAKCSLISAIAVCGTGSVSDSRLGSRTHSTGNGPQNYTRCGP